MTDFASSLSNETIRDSSLYNKDLAPIPAERRTWQSGIVHKPRRLTREEVREFYNTTLAPRWLALRARYVAMAQSLATEATLTPEDRQSLEDVKSEMYRVINEMWVEFMDLEKARQCAAQRIAKCRALMPEVGE